jgi:hypothetical protein
VFPSGTSDLFITSSGAEVLSYTPCNFDPFSTAYNLISAQVRVWHARRRAELLRIAVPGVTCHAVAVGDAGASIVTGWSDGRVRAFLPQSGKLLYAIPDAHPGGVTAVAVSHSGTHILTGCAQRSID